MKKNDTEIAQQNTWHSYSQCMLKSWHVFFISGVVPYYVQESLIKNTYKPSILTEYSRSYKILCTHMAPRSYYDDC